MRIILVMGLLLFGMAVTAQTPNSHLFIEPNVSLSFDSTILNVQNRLSDARGTAESYSFKYLPANAYVIMNAQSSAESPTQQHQDGLIQESIKRCNKLNNDTLQVCKEAIIIHYKGFSGFGFIAKVKKEEKYAVSFYVSKFYDGGFCTLYYYAASPNKIDSYENDKNSLTSILDGITTYTRRDSDIEDSLLLLKYTITIDSIGKPDDFPAYLKRTFFGKVTVKPRLENIVKEVSIATQYGSQLFTPQPDGQIVINCNDNETGEIEKKGELVVLNRFGKQVRIPFTFKYTRN